MLCRLGEERHNSGWLCLRRGRGFFRCRLLCLLRVWRARWRIKCQKSLRLVLCLPDLTKWQFPACFINLLFDGNRADILRVKLRFFAITAFVWGGQKTFKTVFCSLRSKRRKAQISRFFIHARFLSQKIKKLSAYFYFDFPNRSKMSSVLRVLGAREYKNTPHNRHS